MVSLLELDNILQDFLWGFTPGWIHGGITDTNSCINSKDKSQKFISAEDICLIRLFLSFKSSAVRCGFN